MRTREDMQTVTIRDMTTKRSIYFFVSRRLHAYTDKNHKGNKFVPTQAAKKSKHANGNDPRYNDAKVNFFLCNKEYTNIPKSKS